MALVWLDSFDSAPSGQLHYRYDAATGASPARFFPVAARTASGMYVDATGGAFTYLTKVLPATTRYTVGFAVKMSSLVGDCTLLMLASAGSDHVHLTMQGTTGRLQVKRATGVVYATSQSALTTGGYTYVELSAFASLTSGSFELRMDNAIEASGSGVATLVNAPLIYDRIKIGTFAQSVTVDDLYVTTGSGSTSTSFLGPVKIACLVPNGAGSASDWRPQSAGANYLQVDELAQDADASYVTTAKSGDTDLYALPNLPALSVPGTVYAVTGVMVGMVSRRDDLEYRDVAPLLRVNGANYAGPSETPGTSYTFSAAFWDRSPATGAPWTSGEITALEAGVTLTG